MEERKTRAAAAEKKGIRDVISTLAVALVVLLALALVGVRLLGFQVYTILSGSMEPTYHVGSIIYVKPVDPLTVREGQAITFMLDANTVATHRVVEILPDETQPGVVRFRTKGDANSTPDGAPVHSRNVIGVPVFTIPYLGYVAAYVQNPPGRYVAIAALAIALILIVLPDSTSADNKAKRRKEARDEESAEI